MAAFEAVGRRSIPRWGIFTRDHECFVIDGQSRVERGTTFCPWSVVDARDSAKVLDQVQLLARTLTD